MGADEENIFGGLIEDKTYKVSRELNNGFKENLIGLNMVDKIFSVK